MILHVTEARYERDYIILLTFNDGAEGYVDLAEELYGEMFEPLKDKEKFKAFRVDPELETIAWENGADLAPEFLHDRLKVRSSPDSPDEPSPAAYTARDACLGSGVREEFPSDS